MSAVASKREGPDLFCSGETFPAGTRCEGGGPAAGPGDCRVVHAAGNRYRPDSSTGQAHGSRRRVVRPLGAFGLTATLRQRVWVAGNVLYSRRLLGFQPAVRLDRLTDARFDPLQRRQWAAASPDRRGRCTCRAGCDEHADRPALSGAGRAHPARQSHGQRPAAAANGRVPPRLSARSGLTTEPADSGAPVLIEHAGPGDMIIVVTDTGWENIGSSEKLLRDLIGKAVRRAGAPS